MLYDGVMNEINKNCEKCGGLLKYPEYALDKKEGEHADKTYNLICNNPDCSNAKKN